MARFSPLLTTALLTLAACGGGETNTANDTANTPANGATANEAVAPANQAASSQPAPAAGAVTADYMVGKWSATDEDCSSTIEFRKDWTVATPLGDAKWTLTGDQLAIDYGDGSTLRPSTIKPLGPDRIEISDSSGKETQKRC